jgi:hypothetical protein
MNDINKALQDIGEAILNCLAYKKYPLEKLEEAIIYVDEIIINPSYLSACENHFKTSQNNVLFYISNIIYNLKTKGELNLTPDVLKWLCGVWKNFLQRNHSYQKLFPLIDEYRIKLKRHYPGQGNFVQQIVNVNQVREEYLTNIDIENPALVKLQTFQQLTSEIVGWMRPTYFFLIDFYYERKLKAGEDHQEGINLERQGINQFGQTRYTYGDLVFLNCQALGILEAVYLILKKKKSSRQIIKIDGKQKFLSIPETYMIYLEKFNQMKKELKSIRDEE